MYDTHTHNRTHWKQTLTHIQKANIASTTLVKPKLATLARRFKMRFLQLQDTLREHRWNIQGKHILQITYCRHPCRLPQPPLWNQNSSTRYSSRLEPPCWMSSTRYSSRLEPPCWMSSTAHRELCRHKQAINKMSFTEIRLESCRWYLFEHRNMPKKSFQDTIFNWSTFNNVVHLVYRRSVLRRVVENHIAHAFFYLLVRFIINIIRF